jgi:hypothetical protein
MALKIPKLFNEKEQVLSFREGACRGNEFRKYSMTEEV